MSIDYKIELDYKPAAGQGYKPNTSTHRYTPSNYNDGGQTQTVTTAEEQLVQPSDISSLGLMLIRNLSSTTGNYLQIGKATGNYFSRIPPSEEQLIWLEPGITLFAKFATTTGKVEYRIFDR